MSEATQDPSDNGVDALQRAKVRGIDPKTTIVCRVEKMNGKETRSGIRSVLGSMFVCLNSQLQTPTIGSWSRLAKSTINATDSAEFPNVPLFLDLYDNCTDGKHVTPVSSESDRGEIAERGNLNHSSQIFSLPPSF